MPELPEVETVVRELRPLLVGRGLAGVQVSRQSLRRRWVRSWHTLLRGRVVQEIRRRGKWIVVLLEGELFLVLHLGMTGQLTVTPARLAREDHTHLIFDLEGGEHQLRFRDIRRFGSATVLHGQEPLDAFFARAGLGPEPFELDPAYWRERLAATARCLKAVLLDQRVVAGVGNIYADESLFEARLHPARLGREIIPAEAASLRRAIVKVLHRAIDKRGSTIQNYVGGSGLKGEYQNEFRVYGRTGEPCPRCGRSIERIRLAGRSTHLCAGCQRVQVDRRGPHIYANKK